MTTAKETNQTNTAQTAQSDQHTQILVVGGGINGVGIAADAAGRGISVRVVEQADLAAATSSNSSKLIHGGLRYLEHYEFRLVREALAEREVLLHKAPHLIKPMRFILPHRRHLRPAWMIRCGMFLYDNLSRLNKLPRSKRVKFNALLDPVKSTIKSGFEYSDCWVDDSRLVVLNAVDAKQRGAIIETYTRCQQATFIDGLWRVTLEDVATGNTRQVTADILVNGAGPWAQKFIEQHLQRKSSKRVRLIKGSHLIMPSAYNGDQAFILQNEDRRIVFVIPYLDQYTIIGTTDKEYIGDPAQVSIDSEEIEYLLSIYNKHFKVQFTKNDIVGHYSGVRPLCDDESDDPSAITRDYTLELEMVDKKNGAGPLLNIFGGKLTTYRKLSEAAMEKLAPLIDNCGAAWTAFSTIPGGDIAPEALEEQLAQQFPWLPCRLRRRWIISYGSLTFSLLEGCESLEDLGLPFCDDLYEREVKYLYEQEWARKADDILMRRTKIGVINNSSQLREQIDQYLQSLATGKVAPTNDEPQQQTKAL